MKKLTLLFVIALTIQVTVSSQPCLPEGITFTTQTQIDSFQIVHPNCTEIEGDVLIEGNDITNLNGLSILTVFGGNLSIMNNPALTSLTGLGNVTAIAGSLIFDFNYALTSLTGLDNVISIGGDLGIGNSTSLTSLTGLDNVTSIGGGLYIDDNAALTSLTGLDYVTSIGGLLYIDFNVALSSLTGLNNLVSIGGGLVIFENNTLTSLTGLDNVTTIGEYLSIDENDALTDLTGLDNVTSIGGFIGISFNDALTSLTGLNNVTSIGGTLGIVWNNALTSLTGLENIDAASIIDLDIYNNNSLSTCEVQSVCDYLASPNGDIEIHDNAIGCNSQEEVEDACHTIGVPDINAQFEFIIYPNPAKRELFISSKSGVKINEVNIYNQLGQKRLQQTRTTNKIDISTLGQGMYVIEIVSNKSSIREKLIIK
ncbi:MAG: T9SS type A sorting domain-containing protein [Bacteroidales bacterium]|nr:T9SS type A sorting domain-containing protein [Bacteroidales bacterium]